MNVLINERINFDFEGLRINENKIIVDTGTTRS